MLIKLTISSIKDPLKFLTRIGNLTSFDCDPNTDNSHITFGFSDSFMAKVNFNMTDKAAILTMKEKFLEFELLGTFIINNHKIVITSQEK